MEPPAWKDVTTRPLTPEEITLITRTLADRGQHRDVLFVMAGASTGFRASELLTLQWGQLVAADGQIAREVTIARRLLKGGRGGRARAIRSRRVALGERAREAIADYLATLTSLPTPDTYVFRSRKGDNRPITRTQALHILKEAARLADIPTEQVGVHSLRKVFAKGVYAGSGCDLVLTQRLLGHTSPLTTARYLQTSDTELDEVVLGFDPLAAKPAAGSVATPNLNRLLAQ